MSRTVKELFEEQIPGWIARNEGAREVGAVFCFRVAGDEGGVWTVDLASEAPSCRRGETAAPQCVVEITHDDFVAMLAEPQAGMQLYFEGKLRISGDPAAILKLPQLLSSAAGD